jgi:hypothetical protein
MEEYVGYIPLPDESIAETVIDELDPELMWQQFVSTRRPVLIDGLVDDSNFEGDKWQNLDFIRSIAGSVQVKIEPIHPTNDRFGTSVKREQVPLSLFLDMLKEKDLAGRWYMTTQYQSDEEDADSDEEESARVPSTASSSLSPRAEISSKSSLHVSSAESSESPSEKDQQEPLSQSTESSIDSNLLSVDLDLELPPPTDALAHLFPLPAPSLMGGLVLQQCNLWMGNGLSGKSSGLHHDFHDNLYMLLSGRKRFLIWPPVAHRWLEPVGEVFRVHRNGLMEYHGTQQPMLRPDGLTELDAASWRVRARQRAVHEADEHAAQQSGEVQKRKRHRKGKAKQTTEQEQALFHLQRAEARLSLLEQEESDLSGGVRDDDVSSIPDSPLRSLSAERDCPDTSEDEEEHESNQRAVHRLPQRQRRGFSLSSSEEGDSEEEDNPSKPPTKRQRHGSDNAVLSIPFRGLPGGLRGSTYDLDGEYSSGSSDEFDERAEFAMLEHRQRGDLERLAETVTIEMAVEDGQSESDFANEGTDDILDDSNEEEDEDSVETDAALLEVLQDRFRQKAGKARMVGTGAHGTSDDEHSEGEDDSSAETEEEGLDESDTDEDALWANAEDGEALLAQLDSLQAQGYAEASAQRRVEIFDDNEDDDDDEKSAQSEEKSDPPSFSRISPQVLHWYFEKPPYPGCKPYTGPPRVSTSSGGRVCLLPAVGCPAPIEVHLKAGQMLYLPASWYHEVTSYLPPDEQNEDGTNVHMALNYWFHPPTAVKSRDALQDPLGRRRGKQAADTRADGLSSHKVAQKESGNGEGGVSNACQEAPRMRDHTRPYLDEEVWNEIRLEVQKKCESVRARARARSKQEKS